MEVSPSSEPVRNLGKYSLAEKLGEGSLGPVYRGFDPELGRPVVVRILRDGGKWDAKAEELFFRECRPIADLQHPNIAAIYEIGKEGQSLYMVIESLGANTLLSLAGRKPSLTVESKLWIMIQIAEGLCHAHKKGILHLILSPAKIHLTAGGIKIRDFTLAHVLLKHLSRPGVRFGMPIYLSPERIQNQNCDERSDVFSAGMVFYELLTCLHPFHDKDSNKALDSILSGGELPTFEKFPDVPPAIWPILRTCLARNPKDRYQNMDEVLGACKELMEDLAEDTRLMLAELHASLAPLRRAAARNGAPAGVVRLSRDAQKLLGGNDQADYVSLDRMMTEFLEQYPLIREAANELQKLEAEGLELPLKIFEINGISKYAARPLEAKFSGIGIVSQERSAAPPATGAADAPLIPPPESTGLKAKTVLHRSNVVAATRSPHCGMASPIVPNAGAPDAGGANIAAIQQTERPLQNLIADSVPISNKETETPPRPRWFQRPICGLVAASLPILLMAVAIYLTLGAGAATSLRRVLTNRILHLQTPAKASVPPAGSRNVKSGFASKEQWLGSEDQKTVSVLLKEARTLAGMNRFEESKILLSRILEIDPACMEAGAILEDMEESSGESRGGETSQTHQKQLARVVHLIESGKLLRAKRELDRLLQSNPNLPEGEAARRREIPR